MLNVDKIQSKETFFVNKQPYFYLALPLTIINRQDILNKLQEYDGDAISEIDDNFRMRRNVSDFTKELDKMLDLTKQEMIGFINVLKEELSKQYILNGDELVNDFIDKINDCLHEHNFITIEHLEQFSKFKFNEFCIDENLTKLIPKNGINKDDVKLIYRCRCGKHFKYEFSKDYLTYNNNKIVNIFKDIPHTDSIIVDKTCCFNLIDSDNFLEQYMYKREDYQQGAIFMDFRVCSNFKSQILKLIKKYKIEYEIHEVFKNLI